MLANRLKCVLEKLIREGQVSFVPNINITDNIIATQEIVHTMRKRRSEKSMAIKIDLQKAYDRLSWEFIEDTLREAFLPKNFMKFIMFYITSVSI